MSMPCGYQQITDVSASIGLIVPTPSTAAANLNVQQKPTYALIIAETQAVRWRDDGTAPSATVGMPLAVGTVLRYDGDLAKIRFFEQTASAKLSISYYY